MAEPEVVNPANPMFRYGEGTRLRRWNMLRNGFIQRTVMPLPPFKKGEPISKAEEYANKEAKKQEKIVQEWLVAKSAKDAEILNLMWAKYTEKKKAQLESEEYRQMLIRNEAILTKLANTRRKKMIKAARNFPCRGFPLLMKNLLKKKNASRSGKLVSG